MPKCKNCREALSSKVILVSFWNGYQKFKCSNCSIEYAFTLKDRLIGALVIGLSTFITSITASLFELSLISLGMYWLLTMTVLSGGLSILSSYLITFEINDK